MPKFTECRPGSKTIACCICSAHPETGVTVFKEDGKWYCRKHKPTKPNPSLEELCSLIEGRNQK